MAWVHRMLDKNPETMTGTCENCGPVDVIRKGAVLRCGVAVRKQRHPPGQVSGWSLRQPGRHGLLLADARALKAGRTCEICGSPADLVIDHCHVTNQLRGILCGLHNRGLGQFRDSIEELEAGIAYLRKYAPRDDEEAPAS